LASLIAATQRWHAGVTNGEFLQRQLPSEVFMTRLFERHPAYELAMRSASELESAIQVTANDRLNRIRNAERLNMALTIFLTLLALTSALLVAGLGRQTRLLAREAVRRRREAELEAGEAKVARAAAENEERRAAFLASAVQELTSSLEIDRTVETLKKLFAPNLAETCTIELGEAAAQEETEHLPSKMVMPLISRGQKLGVVTLTAPAGHVFTRDDRQLAEELARTGSLAVDNSLLYRDAQQALRAREEVLAIVSHDLRNPLNSIMLAGSLLESAEHLGGEDREQVEVLQISAKRMKRLIEDLLDVTRLEGGKQLPIEPAPLDVRPLMDETYELFKPLAASNSISLRCHVADGVNRVYADHHRVSQVFSNLIGNALKFTPAGGMITVNAEPFEGAMILFSVSDTGSGIPKQHLGDIFNPYWQAKRAERLGAGLGLAITKGIVESHGGRIWVESKPAEGTKFYFTLPTAKKSAEVSSRRAEESPAHR
jgi:signal transduction histidine kinase/cell division protein FtsB